MNKYFAAILSCLIFSNFFLNAKSKIFRPEIYVTVSVSQNSVIGGANWVLRKDGKIVAENVLNFKDYSAADRCDISTKIAWRSLSQTVSQSISSNVSA
jgi:hypothetical protein